MASSRNGQGRIGRVGIGKAQEFVARRLLGQGGKESGFGPAVAEPGIKAPPGQHHHQVGVDDRAVEVDAPALTRRGQVAEPPTIFGIVNLNLNAVELVGQLLDPGGAGGGGTDKGNRLGDDAGAGDVFKQRRQQARQVRELLIDEDGDAVVGSQGAAQGGIAERRFQGARTAAAGSGSAVGP